MSKAYQELSLCDFAYRQRVFCALAVPLPILVFCLFQDGSLFAARLTVGVFSVPFASVAVLLAIGLAALCLCELSRSLAVAGKLVRAVPAAYFPGPNRSSLGWQRGCHADLVQGLTGSTLVWGNGQTSCVHPLRSCRFYSRDVKHQLKTAIVAREVSRSD
jgi:hypothetical protein